MKITNSEIAKILYEISAYLEMDGVAFKPRAYEKAAEDVESLSEELDDLYRKGGLRALENIPGIGASIGEKIEELIKTGKLKYYEGLKKKIPVDLPDLLKIEGLGPKKIKSLYEKLKIKNIKDLEKAIAAGKIKKLEGFGEKSEQNILRGLEFLKKSGGRFLLGYIILLVNDIAKRLKSLKEVQRLDVGGSIRRRKETVGDGDILIVSDKPRPVMDYFVNMPEVDHILAHGETKSSVKLKNGLEIDLRVVRPESYGAALAYFTGSKDHNIQMREMAIKKGWKLNEYGLFKKIPNPKSQIPNKSQNPKTKGKNVRDQGLKINDSWEQISAMTEESLYKALGMDYIEPELREMNGEIETALDHKLPKLIRYDDLRGDLQVQTNWTDGSASIEEMARAAIKNGLEYIVITDHTKRLAMTHGLDEKRIQQQWKEIDQVNKKIQKEGTNFVILKGTECDILKDGSLDLPDDILKKLDVVGVSVHSLFNLPEKEQTERIITAMKNPNVDILFHPTGRLIQKREPYSVDMSVIIQMAKETGTVLEIDAFPERLDLKDEYIRMAVKAGVKLSIDSDAHDPSHFPVLQYGIAQARRGWAEKKDIINAWPLNKMKKMLKD